MSKYYFEIAEKVTVIFIFSRYERTAADYIEKLPSGKQSCKGVGRTQPAEKGYKDLAGVTVPAGKGQTAKGVQSSLLYNEYIIYNTSQCTAKYLFRMKFNYKF